MAEKKSEYTTVLAPKTSCPNCNSQVWMLAKPDPTRGPSFYICFNCRFVGELGVGPVKEVEDWRWHRHDLQPLEDDPNVATSDGAHQPT